MRNTSPWRSNLIRHLRDQWSDIPTRIGPAALCDVELGLTLLEELLPNTPARALWVILVGYPFPIPEAETWSEEQHQMLSNARHLLTAFKSPYPWQRTLEHYRQIDERLRGYTVSNATKPAVRRAVSVCANRWDVYSQALRHAPHYARTEIHWATAGNYGFVDRRHLASVRIPADLSLPPLPAGHHLGRRSSRTPLALSWDDLIETARWMDLQLRATSADESPESQLSPRTTWEQRLSRMELEVFNQERTALAKTTVLYLDGLTHLIGMVSSGKSTLMDVLAVWAARNDKHITLVVGDVISALDRVDLFLRLGLRAAPILGASNRERHVNRLHRALAGTHPAQPLTQGHTGFRWLSSACPLDGLRDTPKPLPMGMQPCLRLYAPSEVEDNAEDSRPLACPLYSVCPFHHAQRELVDANIWIATPASLVYTRVAPQLNQEQLRFAELIYRRSDLVIVDEADQVQVQLDHIFSPNQTLVSRSADAWLSRLSQQVLVRINQEGRGQLGDERVAAWCQAHDVAQSAASRVYALLLQTPTLQHEIEQDYFTAWIILERLALAMSGADSEKREHHAGYGRLMHIFERFVDDPLGEREEQELAELARQVLTMTTADRVRSQISAWLSTHIEPGVDIAAQLSDMTVLLEFALAAGVLSNRLDMLLREWRFIERPLQLEGDSSFLFHRPPEDYTPILPAAPMGNVLAFQYIRSGDDPDGPGDLRFFRCMGVGRWLLLHFHELFAGDGIAGPHVLLLSGTSWAGSAPGYHIQAPVTGILRAPQHEINAITQSVFQFEPFYDREGRPIRVSGSRGHARATAINNILSQLARRGGLGGPSRLERLRESLPAGRQRILLLVGSYDEARAARAFLEQLRPDWRGQVLHLVSDDDQFESQWRSDGPGLQRGLVYRFASTGAWILIAPLLAVERGHNILNEQDQAAIGAVYFLVRPHPRPDDIGYAIHSINRWAVERHGNAAWLKHVRPEGHISLETIGDAFREAAYRRWRFLLRLPMIYSSLPDDERDAVTWSQMVTIWQVIGRLVRGGVPAQVYFCDAAFAPSKTGPSEASRRSPSLLEGMFDVLRPYFSEISTVSPADRVLVQALYGPFYIGLPT